MKDNEYNIALQDRYDELILHSKEIWSDSAAGGFSRKKVHESLQLGSKSGMKSPEKLLNPSKELTKKESSISSNTIGSIKKTVIKLN